MKACLLAWWLVSSVIWTAVAQVGERDTVGGTTYDWQGNGPVWRMYCAGSGSGRHALWMYSGDTSGTVFPDRNMRYNYYDGVAGSWNWIDPSFMSSGVNVYTARSGFGNIGNNPNTGAAVVVAHQGMAGSLLLVLARDLVGGGGVFEFCRGPDGYIWPVLAVDARGWYHCAMMDDYFRDRVWYSRCTTWCQWDSALRLSGLGAPDPGFPSHNIAASAVSQKVCVAWVNAQAEPQESIYYVVSTDGGTTWGIPEVLPMPPAYGGDTLPTFTITSPFPYYDRQDRLHFVTDVAPVVRDTAYDLPAEIWHWCEANTPQWSRIHRAGCAPRNLRGMIGYNATYACRASIGEDRQGNLMVAWEQFDSMNVEGLTGMLRAGIWVAASFDNGMNWYMQRLITSRNTVSHRFPCIVDYHETFEFQVLYMDDLIAGFVVQGQGRATRNPIIAHRWNPLSLETESAPTGFGRATILRGAPVITPAKSDVRYSVFDASGRQVRELGRGGGNPRSLSPGVYLLQATDRSGSVSWSRLVVLR